MCWIFSEHVLQKIQTDLLTQQNYGIEIDRGAVVARFLAFCDQSAYIDRHAIRLSATRKKY